MWMNYWLLKLLVKKLIIKYIKIQKEKYRMWQEVILIVLIQLAQNILG